MNSMLLDRIQSQIPPKNKIQEKVIINEVILSEPLSIDELKGILQNIIKNAKINVVKNDFIEFDSFYHFVDWYIQNKYNFNDNQKRALDTLIEAKNLIFNGCSCKRQQHEQGAFNYYKDFILRNQENDLFPTILKITNVNKIIFKNILIFPATTQ